MTAGFFFYDLETSGLDARQARIMQFAGQRTDLKLNPVGEPVNKYIKITPDVLPDPDAVLITGITPQMTFESGMTEAEFLRYFQESICMPGTIFTGFNSVRFDDEFMRYLFYRNFYDAYRWQWCDGCSRWDVLDVVRMTRALRPDGITWPNGPDGKPSNRLELLTHENGLDHEHAHDALEDVNATIAVAKLILQKQPKLFAYLLEIRDKKKAGALAGSGQPFVYSSGSYPSEFEKTTVVVSVGADQKSQGALAYDLRSNPDIYAELTVRELADAMRRRYDRKKSEAAFPVKLIRFNRCPAVAPLSVLDAASKQRIGIDMDAVEANFQKLSRLPEFKQKLAQAYKLLDDTYPQAALLPSALEADGQLYDGFLDKRDETMMDMVHQASAEDLGSMSVQFHDSRLNALLPLYKARNFPAALSNEDREEWEQFRMQRLMGGGAASRLAKYVERIQQLAAVPGLTPAKQYLLEELRLYGESIVPTDSAL